MPHREGPIRVDDDATRDLVARAAAYAREHDPAEAARRLARMAGSRVRGDHLEFGVWLPEPEGATDADAVELEFLTLDAPPEGVTSPHGADGRARPSADERHPARRQRLAMVREGAWAWLALRGATLGTRERLGSLYRVVITGADGRESLRHDPLAASLPFGLHGPAELYDVPHMHLGREDVDFFRRIGLAGDDEAGEPPRFGPPAHLLEVHVGTATHGGTIADLTDLFRELARKLEAGEEPTPGEACFLGHDAVQLMPLDPVATDGAAPPRFEADGDGPVVMVTLRPPRAFGWGYDVGLHGAAAIEPALLRSGRPDELVDLAAVLHTFPGKPIRLALDLVVGHAHERARELLPPGFLSGGGAYGPRPDLTRPEVRALLLEAQRRKMGFGADTLRVDAAHDLAVPGEDGGIRPDDAFLAEMSEVVQRVAEVRYRPFMIFEDGRPRSGGAGPPSFREVTRQQPHAFQWGPLTLAHAHPHLAGFWAGAWWRLAETADHGSHWITGSANHDTLRGATHLAGHLPIAARLGADRPAVLRRAFDHPAADLLTYGLLPGVPQTFVSALLRAPWAFFRSEDGDDAVAVAAAEAGVLAWRFTPEDYAAEGAFERLKGAGLHDHAAAVAWFEALRARLADPRPAAPRGGGEAAIPPAAASPAEVARAFLADLRDACVVWTGERHLDPGWVAASRRLRRLRADRPWLARDAQGRDRLERRVRADGSLAVVGVRHAPDGGESVALLANLAGEPWTVVPAEALHDSGWEELLASPGASWQGVGAPLTLADGEGVLLCREG